jgi:hypothetical protein
LKDCTNMYGQKPETATMKYWVVGATTEIPLCCS